MHPLKQQTNFDNNNPTDKNFTEPDTPLYKGYYIWDPREDPAISVRSAMHFWGDGELALR
jgi:hypothetical protein